MIKKQHMLLQATCSTILCKLRACGCKASNLSKCVSQTLILNNSFQFTCPAYSTPLKKVLMVSGVMALGIISLEEGWKGRIAQIWQWHMHLSLNKSIHVHVLILDWWYISTLYTWKISCWCLLIFLRCVVVLISCLTDALWCYKLVLGHWSVQLHRLHQPGSDLGAGDNKGYKSTARRHLITNDNIDHNSTTEVAIQP